MGVVLWNNAFAQTKTPMNRFKPESIVGDWFYVQGLHPYYHQSWVDTLATQVGVKGLRIGFEWWEIEKSKKVFDWAAIDSVFKVKDKYNLKYIVTPGYGNGLYSVGGQGQSQYCRSFDLSTELEMNAYIDFLKVGMERYKNKGVIWEIINEPDLFIYLNDPAGCRAAIGNITKAQQGVLYASLLKKVAEQVRPLFPNETIITGGLAFAGSDFTNAFIDQAATDRSFNAFDAFGFHEYEMAMEKCNPSDQLNSGTWKLGQLSSRLQQNGYTNTTFLNTETGGSGGDNFENSPYDDRWDGFDLDGSLSDLQQAAYIPRTYLYGLTNSSSLYVYHKFFDEPRNWQGIVDQPRERYFGLMDTLNKRKPSFYAMKTMLLVLGGYTLVQNNSQCNTADKVNWKMLNAHLVFVKNQDTTHAVWAVQDATGKLSHTRVVRYFLPNGSYKTTGMLNQNYGNTVVTNGFADILIDEMPVYLAKNKTVTGFDETNMEAINQVFPNPFKDEINVSNPQSWTLISSTGSIVAKGNSKTIVTSEIQNGLYLLKLENGATYKLTK